MMSIRLLNTAKSRLKIGIILWLWTMVFLETYAQDHTQSWMKLSIQHHLNEKITGSLELHHRTQSLVNTESPVRYPLADAFRFWLIHKISKNQSLNFSPYAFFSNNPTAYNEQDVIKSNNNEHRVQIQYESKTHLAGKWLWQNREGVEYRLFENNSDLLRIRIREGIGCNIHQKIQVMLYDELFLNTMNVDTTHIFDQNRIGLLLSYTIDKHFKLDIGTNLIHARPRNVADIATNYVFSWSIQYAI